MSLLSDPSTPARELLTAATTMELPALLAAVRRHLHRYPEVGLKEYETSRFLRQLLERHGFEVHGPVAGTGLFVEIEGARPGPRVGYRADIDALPIQDAKTCAYASCRAGVAHLCGHDAHTSIGIGVALLLRTYKEALHGTVRVFFQPNEESQPSGATLMIRDGILRGVEAVFAVHVDPSLESGRFGLITGPATAAADQFDIQVQGTGTGHSARPHEVVDTVWVAVQIASALYQLTGRVTDARFPAVLTICRIHAGEAYNVMPDRVAFGGTLRSTDPSARTRLTHLLEAHARETGARYGAEVTVTLSNRTPPVVNDPDLVAGVETTLTHLYGEGALHRIPRPSMGAEDFAHYLEHVPGVLVRVGTGANEQTRHPLHDARFDLDESALAPAARLMARVLVDHLAHRAAS